MPIAIAPPSHSWQQPQSRAMTAAHTSTSVSSMSTASSSVAAAGAAGAAGGEGGGGGQAVGITQDNPSECWNTPGDIDGALIRRTYAHFDLVGVPGDGILDGIELTRERTHPLPFAWADDRRAPSSASQTRPEHSSGTQDSTNGTRQANGTGEATSSSFKRRSLVLSPHKTAIAIGTTATPSSHSHATTASDYLSAGSPGGATTPGAATPGAATPSQPTGALVSTPQLNVTPATPTIESGASTQAASRRPSSAEDPKSSNDQQRTGRQDHRPDLPARVSAGPPSPSPSHPSFISPALTAARRRRTQEMDSEQRLDKRLQCTDRYGFFANSLATSSHAKAVVLPSTSSSASPSATAATSNHQDAPPDPVRTALRRREQERNLRERERPRIDKWARMLVVSQRDAGGNASLYTFRADKAGIHPKAGLGKSKKLRRRCYKGIPDRWRSAAWLALLERKAAAAKEKQPSVAELEAQYEAAFRLPSEYDVQIDLDVPRTMSGHVLFHTRYGQGQRALFHVLHAFSLYCSMCGYCQGMGPIAASLLVYLEPARAYVALVRLHDVHGLHAIFSPGFPGLVENFHVQEELIRVLLPPLAASMDEHGIDASSFATKWYITLFANSVPFETQVRMWDVFFLDGQDALVGVALGVLSGIQRRLAVGDEIVFDTEPFVADEEGEEGAATAVEAGTNGSAVAHGAGDATGGAVDASLASSLSGTEGDLTHDGLQKADALTSATASPKPDDKASPSKKLLKARPSTPANASNGSASHFTASPKQKASSLAKATPTPAPRPARQPNRPPSFESVLGALTSYIIPADDGALLRSVEELMARPDIRAKMQEARRNWRAQVGAKEEGDDVREKVEGRGGKEARREERRERRERRRRRWR